MLPSPLHLHTGGRTHLGDGGGSTELAAALRLNVLHEPNGCRPDASGAVHCTQLVHALLLLARAD